MRYLKKFENNNSNKLDFDTFKELMYEVTDDIYKEIKQKEYVMSKEIVYFTYIKLYNRNEYDPKNIYSLENKEKNMYLFNNDKYIHNDYEYHDGPSTISDETIEDLDVIIKYAENIKNGVILYKKITNLIIEDIIPKLKYFDCHSISMDLDILTGKMSIELIQNK